MWPSVTSSGVTSNPNVTGGGVAKCLKDLVMTVVSYTVASVTSVY